jgi:hypothetical protein
MALSTLGGVWYFQDTHNSEGKGGFVLIFHMLLLFTWRHPVATDALQWLPIEGGMVVSASVTILAASMSITNCLSPLLQILFRVVIVLQRPLSLEHRRDLVKLSKLCCFPASPDAFQGS